MYFLFVRCVFWQGFRSAAAAIRCRRRRCRQRIIQLFTRKKKWSVHFTAEHLSFLLVPQKQVKKDKGAQDTTKPTTRSSTGVPKANNLKRAFRKLERAYEKPFKLYAKAEKEAANVVHRMPSLSLQLTGSRVQDHVSR